MNAHPVVRDLSDVNTDTGLHVPLGCALDGTACYQSCLRCREGLWYFAVKDSIGNLLTAPDRGVRLLKRALVRAECEKVWTIGIDTAEEERRIRHRALPEFRHGDGTEGRQVYRFIVRGLVAVCFGFDRPYERLCSTEVIG